MTEITVIAKTVTEDGDEDIFGPYNTILDFIIVQYTLHKHFGKNISVTYCESHDGEYVLKYIDNNDEFKNIFESFDDDLYKYAYAYPFLKNHHLTFLIKK